MAFPVLPPVMIYGQSCLRGICQAIPLDYPLEALKRQIETLRNVRADTQAYSISAPQIGWKQSVFVALMENEPEEMVFINPIMQPQGEEAQYLPDGCSSIPGFSASVCRYTTVTICYSYIGKDEDGITLAWKQATKTYTGRNAYVVQHEIDHLNGVLFTDHIEVQNPADYSLGYPFGLSNFNSPPLLSNNTSLESIADGNYTVSYNTLNRKQV